MQANITTAAEFIDKTLEASEDMLQNAGELKVLTELAEQDATQAKLSAHEKRLNTIGMLQQSGAEQPQDLFQSLLSSFDDLAKEQNASEFSLKEAFEKHFQSGIDGQKSLLDEQTKLNATNQAETELKEKLTIAVKHLEKAHAQLLQRSQSLRLFLERFGAQPVSKGKHAAALLQEQNATVVKTSNVSHSARHVAKVKTHDANDTSLPETSSVLANSHRVFTAMGSQMAALEARMTDVQQEGALAVSKQKAQYEEKLKKQRAEAHATELVNAHTTNEIEELRKSNADVRKKAEKLAQAGNKLKSDIQGIQANITTAAEFIDKTLAASEEMFENAGELKVLTELAEQDGIQSKAVAHQKRLNTIGMLQQSEKGAEQPQDLLQSLLSSFGDLAKEQNASEALLKEAFEKQFQSGVDRQKSLLEEQAKLNATKQTETELKEKLTVALNHLEKVHAQLLQRRESLQLFLGRFGSQSATKRKNADKVV